MYGFTGFVSLILFSGIVLAETPSTIVNQDIPTSSEASTDAASDKSKRVSANTTSTSMSPTVITGAAAPASGSFVPSLTGMLDLRTGYFSKSGKSDAENAAEIGVNVTPTVHLAYQQAFNVSLYNSPDTTNGQNALLDAGFVRGKFKNLWQSEDKQTAFSYEHRVYLHNSFFQQDINLITVSRSYFKLAQKLNDKVTLTLMEVPILFVNGSAGVRDSANPIFENRVYLMTDINITNKLSVSLPVIFHQTRFLDYKAGAKNNDAWAYVLWVNPEVYYSINNNVTVGVGYSNWTNLVASDLSQTNFANGFEDGIYQAIMTLTF